MTPPNWKLWQRSAYVCSALAIVFAVAGWATVTAVYLAPALAAAGFLAAAVALVLLSRAPAGRRLQPAVLLVLLALCCGALAFEYGMLMAKGSRMTFGLDDIPD